MHTTPAPFARVIVMTFVIGVAIQSPAAQKHPTEPLSGPAGQVLSEPRPSRMAKQRRTTAASPDLDNFQKAVLVGSYYGAVIPLGVLPFGGFVHLRFEAVDVDSDEDCAIKVWLVNKSRNNGNGFQHMTYRFTGNGRTSFALDRTGEGVMIVQAQEDTSVCTVVTAFECECG